MLEDLAGLAVLFGVAGALLAYVIALGITRWISDRGRATWLGCAVLVAVFATLTIVAIWLTPSEPSSNADAHQHDYSLYPLWVAALLWVGMINSVGAIVGTALARRRASRRSHDREMLRRATSG
jgi:MFS family permease